MLAFLPVNEHNSISVPSSRTRQRYWGFPEGFLAAQMKIRLPQAITCAGNQSSISSAVSLSYSTLGKSSEGAPAREAMLAPLW